jgi:hypothetical protein
VRFIADFLRLVVWQTPASISDEVCALMPAACLHLLHAQPPLQGFDVLSPADGRRAASASLSRRSWTSTSRCSSRRSCPTLALRCAHPTLAASFPHHSLAPEVAQLPLRHVTDTMTRHC